MKFRITSTNFQWDCDIVEIYPCIKDFNYSASVCEEHYKKEYVELSGFDELKRLMDEIKKERKNVNEVVIAIDENRDDELILEIYDGYRE